MKLLPVIDLLRGAVVRGIGGLRHEYKPIQSRLTPSARPADVAGALFDLGMTTAYVADLDAIAHGPPDWPSYQAMRAARPDMRFLLDAGLASSDAAGRLLAADIGPALDGLIAGLESLGGPTTLAQLRELIGSDRLVFSLDLRRGEPIFPAEQTWRERTALDLAATAYALGVRRLIVLDLAAVGRSAGVPTLPLVSELHRQFGDLQLIAGGGVRSLADLAALEDAGCSAALVASALHDGSLTLEQWRQFRPRT